MFTLNSRRHRTVAGGFAMIVGLLVPAAVAATTEPPGTEPPGTEAAGTEAAGTEAAAGTEPAGTGASGEGADLRMWGWASAEIEDTTLTSLLGEYAEESGISVTFEPQPDYDTTLQTALSAGDPPDFFYVDSLKLPDLADAGALQPIPEGAITDPDDIYPSLVEAFTYDDTWYCPPKDFSTLGVVYNVDLLEAAGVEPPTTMDELADAAEALTAEGVVGLSMGAELPRVGPFLAANGGYLVDEDVTEMTLDTEENRATLQFLADLFTNDFAATAAELEAGWPGEAFGQGKAAMVIEGNWIVPYLAENFPDVNWGVVEMPEGSAGRSTYAFTVCYAVGTESGNPDAAWQAIDFLTGPEGAARWTEEFAVMPARESLRDAWLEGHPELEAFLNGAEYALPWQFAPGFADVNTEFNNLFTQLIAGDIDVEEFVEAVTEAGESVL